jgi:arsenite methyltransferase
MSPTPAEKPAALSVIQLTTCGCGDTSERLASDADPRAVVREKYGAVAQGQANSAGCCCGPADAETVTASLGYTAEQLAALPAGANLGLGCGNPLAFAALAPGETVLDLGSGGGIDCFLAAREVGPAGRAIGVDMTPAMIERARANAAKAGLPNVEFRLGEIEHLPVADASVDVIVSNCVVNLSPDKPQVFREALRVLKPGGRLVVSDLVLLAPLDDTLRQSVALYVGCVAGASLREDYLRLMREAGFRDVEVLAESRYTVGSEVLPADSPERRAFDIVSSVKVRAVRP